MTSCCATGYFNAMKFTLDARTGVNLIRAYSERELVIGERIVVGSCIVTADTLITDWPARAPDELTLVQLEPLLALAPQIVLLGAPVELNPAPASLRAELARQGIALEVMDLGAACRTFNILVQEERRVAAALFLKMEPL
jgi:uncharacterized protein